MEELTETLSASFSVSKIPNNPAAPHPRLSNYKVRTSAVDQNERRRKQLEQQKQNRRDYVNLARRLAEDDWKDCSSEEDELDESAEDMDTSTTKTKKHRKKKLRYYRNRLMLSEWLVDVPSDFETEWLMMLCPIGKRSLIVSARGRTAAYGRNGYKLNQFPSLLPGGNRQRTSASGYSILDTIYSEATRTYYVLDVMCWNGAPVYDSDTEFRFYWMRAKFEETPEVSSNAKLNPFKFIPLKYYACDKENLTKPALDGLLFYHKKTHYTFGTTPLVTWLQAWMLPDILNIPVPQSYIDNKPPKARLLPPSPMDVNNPGKAKGKSKAQVEEDVSEVDGSNTME
ncbi:snurportin-1-like isoform X2 [Ptychodera flava]|uniref:snurportin-1-like isoform X2 n=1 Tax=Ptychodera flava TaxID=63121 RepID=UPI003969D633